MADDFPGITNQERPEDEGEARRKSDARYLHLLNSNLFGNLFGVGIGDFIGYIFDANDALLTMLGHSRTEIEAGTLRWTDMTPTEYGALDELKLKETRARGGCGAYEKEMVRPDGTRVPVLLHLAVTPDNPDYLVASLVDLTKQKQAEAALRMSEARFRLLVEGSPDYAFFMLDPLGLVITWNAVAERILGYRADEIIGKHCSVFCTAENVLSGKPQRQLQRTEQGRVEDEGWRVRKDGSRFWAKLTTIALRDHAGKLQGFAKICKDITERRRSEALLSSTLNNVIDGIVGISEQGTIESFNAAAERMFGYMESEVLGQNVKMLLPQPYRSQHDEYLAKYLHTGEARILGSDVLAVGCRKDGTTFPMELAVSEFFLYEQRHFTGVVRDITEKRKLEDQLRQSQKMEAIGQLAGGVAHDFNNLLTVILGYSELLEETLSQNDPRKGAVDAIAEAGHRAASLTRQLLAFSRRSVLEPKLSNLNEIIEETEKMLGRLIGEDIVLTTVLAPDLDQVMVDPSQMDQVLINLAVNSRDAMPLGGHLTIETSNVELDEDYSRLHPEVRPGRYAKLTVTDTGSGMGSEVKTHVFEPFFTTKEPGKGTGNRSHPGE